jgi:hypothetical protein
MSYLEKTVVDAQEHFLKSELYNDIRNKIDIHPVIAALLWYKSKRSEVNTVSPVLYDLLLQCAYHFIIPSDSSELDKIIKNDWKRKNFIAFSPDSNLIKDFCHTKIPENAMQQVNDFMERTDVYVEFPTDALKYGVFPDAIFSTENNQHILCKSDSTFLRSNKRMKEIGSQYTDNLENLVNMIVLYNLSDNKNSTETLKSNIFNAERYRELKNKKKLKSKLKTTSVIKKISLSPPLSKGEWRSSDESKSFEITHAFEVRGHWRWHACGVKYSKRKLIWINSHIKGKGEFIKKVEIKAITT